MGIERHDDALESIEERNSELILSKVRELQIELELARRLLEEEKSQFVEKYAVNYIAYDEDCWPESLRDAHLQYWGIDGNLRLLREELDRLNSP